MNVGACHDFGHLQLILRMGVAMRDYRLADGILLYLSLLDTEIDERSEILTSRLRASANPAVDALAGCAAFVELTDAVIVFTGSHVALVRGGASTVPLFWSRQADRIRLSTTLPLADGGPWSAPGLLGAFLAATLHGSYEPNSLVGTPVAGWWRIRRGHMTTFLGRGLKEEPVVLSAAKYHESRSGVAAQLRAALDCYTTSQQHRPASMLEVSGGFDSTIAGAAAVQRVSADPRMSGVSVHFPYYEFRFEDGPQNAVAAALGIERTVLDGTQMMPYSPSKEPVLFDEPTVFVTGIRHAEAVAQLAHGQGRSMLYVGHGGDQLFATDLAEHERLAYRPNPAAFARPARVRIRQALAKVSAAQWTRRDTGCFVYDARHDIWAKEQYGVTPRSPFTDLAVFQAARAWTEFSRQRGVRPDKSIMVDAAGDLLPGEVTGRMGKVPYDGVWQRAYHVHGDHIAGTIEQVTTVFEYLGVRPSWLTSQASQLQQWRGSAERDVLAAYAVATWLLGQEVRRPTDVEWSDAV